MSDTITSIPVDPDTKQNLKIEGMLREGTGVVDLPRTLKREEWPPNYDAIWLWRRTMRARYETNPETVLNAKKFYANNPIAFINHWCDTHDPRNVDTDKPVWMPFILFEKQELMVRFILSCLDDEQPGLIEKSRTMGASWICVALSVWLWLYKPGVAIGWGSQDAHSVDQIGNPKSIFWKIRELIKRLPEPFLPPLSPDNLKQYVCSNPLTGSSIVGEVGDSIGRGGRTRVYFKDESAHYEHPEAIEASLSENTKVAIDISSVNGLGNLFHRKREAGMDWYPGAKIPRGKTRVFVMDWSDHPEYNETWFKEKKQYHEDQTTAHIFASEIERNYAASVQGTIIPKEWLDNCIDAHVKLGIPASEGKMSGLDIGDSEDGDRNAQAIRSGIVLTYAEEWYARDPGVTARKAIARCVEHNCNELQYDAAGGLGSNVKSEANRLKDEGAMPKNLHLVPWNAGGKVLHPGDRVVPADNQSPRNKDFYTNLKAQAWWHVRSVVYNTHSAITGKGKYDAESGEIKLPDGSTYDIDDLFSIDGQLPLLYKVVKELCQATASRGSKLKLLVDKAPEGTKSPNIADSIVMAYWPMPRFTHNFVDVGLGPKVFVGGEPFIL